MLFYWVNEDFEWASEAERPEELADEFGLSIANTACYTDIGCKGEYCSDPTMMKGSDGGGLVGYETALLYLASASYYALDEKRQVQGVSSPTFRRVYDLAELVQMLRLEFPQ
jgi:hypothetical protein